MRKLVALLVLFASACETPESLDKDAQNLVDNADKPDRPIRLPFGPGPRDAGTTFETDGGESEDAGPPRKNLTQAIFSVTRTAEGTGCPLQLQVQRLKWDLVFWSPGTTAGAIYSAAVEGLQFSPEGADGIYASMLEGNIFASSSFTLMGSNRARTITLRGKLYEDRFTATETSEDMPDCKWLLEGELE